MKHVKLFKINEELSHSELADDLKVASNINVDYLGKGKNWGVSYYKGHDKFEEGGFNSSKEVHNFLIDNDIDYNSKQGFLMMKKIRDKEIAKVPYQAYQRDLLSKKLEDLID